MFDEGSILGELNECLKEVGETTTTTTPPPNTNSFISNTPYINYSLY